MSRHKAVLTGVSGVDAVIAGGMLTSFARHEPAAVQAARRAYRPGRQRGGEQRLNAEPVVAAGGALLVDNADLDPAWIETTLVPVLTDPERIAAMSARASAAGAPDAD